ncbi:MAG: hypothetical protein EPO07_20450 [Verrucomicrobia bacterium]|nr:MAG: hypothetical protein EPO07_20450 [Verrucomicrobiota bacterium]
MTAPAATSSCCSTPAIQSVGAIDASCRWPVLTLLKGAAFWLVVSSVFGLIASLKFHQPTFLAGCEWFTYGRAYAVWADALVYGFCVPSALAAAVWLIARLGKVELHGPVILTAAAKFWHIGVFVGLCGILAGDSTGYEWFELPRYSVIILWAAYLVFAVCALFTHAARTERALYPSHWFLLAALFWFPWILSTAVLLLQLHPVRGVAQAAIAWWYSGNLLVVWLALAGLAASLYLLPKLAEQPLQSRYTALFAFWTLILFGTWAGIPAGAALPAWMPTVSGNASLLLLVPALAIATTVRQTTRGSTVISKGDLLCYTKSGACLLALSLVLLALTGIPKFARVTEFTWFNHSHTALRLYAFAMTMFAAAYHIVPRVTGVTICPRRIRIQFWFAIPGALLLSLPYAVGGLVQGVKLFNLNLSFLDASKASLMAVRVATLGEVLFLGAGVIFLINMAAVIFALGKYTITAEVMDTPKLHTAEVRS